MTQTEVIRARRVDDLWDIELEDKSNQERRTLKARMLVNAAGPWVSDVLSGRAGINSADGIRLVRGSHIVTRKLYDHDKAYFFQGTDGRIIFAIPYEEDFTLIGTTDADHEDAAVAPFCTDEEKEYLCGFASQYFARPVTQDDIVWTYSGVRPLYDDGASSATAATRDYTLTLEREGGAPILNIFGGKITTYRRLAEGALERVAEVFPDLSGPWTAGVSLPGGDFAVGDVKKHIDELQREYPFLTERWARRLFKAYGTEAWDVLGDARSADALGRHFGADLTEKEVQWCMGKEYATCADDVLWRRSKLGLRMSDEQSRALNDWMQAASKEMHG